MKKKNLLKISEMARLNHLSPQTLRLYERKHLLHPEYIDPDTGYRYYTLAQCARLDLIRALKSCRLSLQEIQKILAFSSKEDLLHVLKTQIAHLNGEIDDMRISRSNLLRIQRNMTLLNSLPPFGQIFFEYVPERMIDAQSTEYDFFAQGDEGYKKMQLHMQHYLHRHHLPPSYFINIGTIMDRHNFVTNEYASHRAFIFVDELYPKKDAVQPLPANMHLCIVSNDMTRESEYAGLLHQEIQKHRLTICGDYLCEVLTQFPAHQAKQLIYKIQIPIRQTQ